MSRGAISKAPAYAVFDGGGVKGAALAGALRAAEAKNFEFLGFGGSSAGAIIALLACVGYSGIELEDIVTRQIKFKSLLEDEGRDLDRAKAAIGRLRGLAGLGRARKLWRAWRLWQENADLIGRIDREFGLFDAKPLQQLLRDLVVRKLPMLNGRSPITFRDLAAHAKPLKVVASDVTHRAPSVFQASTHPDMPVLDAVRASICYPFVLKPTRHGSRLYADGGLSSNLPVFLFDQERAQNGLPLLAFDLVTRPKDSDKPATALNYAGDLLATALDASETLIQGMVRGVIHIPILIEKDIHAMDFDLPESEQADLYKTGELCTRRYFDETMPQWRHAGDIIQQLQARYGAPASFTRVLDAVALSFEIVGGDDVCACVMLPTGRGTSIVVYSSSGMQQRTDSRLEIAIDAGCSGLAMQQRRPLVADMQLAAREYKDRWRLTEEQQLLVPRTLKLMVSTPIFAPSRTRGENATPSNRRVIGTLSVDTTGSIDDTSWASWDSGELRPTKAVLDLISEWSDVFGQMLDGR